MANGGIELATLAARVDFSDVPRASGALDDLVAAGQRAETQVGRLGRSSEASFRQAAIAARNGALATVDALEREFELSEASIREAVARGFITNKEAERAGREAAKSYNASVLRAIDQAQGAGALNRNTSAGADAFVKLTGSLKDVDAVGRRAGLGLGRLNDAMVTVVRQTTGLNSISGKLIDTVGTFAIGTAYMIPVLAGLAALGAAWELVTREAREARKAQEEAATRGLDAARLRDLGPAGRASEDLARVEARLAELRRERAEIEATPVSTAGLAGAAVGGGLENARIIAAEERQRRLAEIEDEITEKTRSAEEFRLQVFENVSREQQSIDDDRRRSAEELARERERLAREEEQLAKAAAAETERAAQAEARRAAGIADVVQSLEDQLAAEAAIRGVTNAGTRADLLRGLEDQVRLRGLLKDATDEEAAAIKALFAEYQRLRDANELAARTSAEFLATLPPAFEATGDAAEAAAERVRKSMSDAAFGFAADFSKAFGDVGDAIAGAVAEFEKLRGAGVSAGGALSAAFGGGLTAGVGAIFAQGVGNIFSSRDEARRREAELEAARERFEDALDAFVAGLTDRSRYEQLRKDAQDRAQDLTDLFSEAFADETAPITLPVTDDLDEFLENLPAGQPFWTPEMLRSWERIRDSIIADFERIEEARKAEAEAVKESVQVRILQAQGLDDEADALALEIERKNELARARELEDEALVALLQDLYALEDAALAAAEAAAEASRIFSEGQLGLDLDARDAVLAGDPEAAAFARAEARRREETRAAEEAFEAGEIGIDTFERWIDVIDREFIRAIEDATEATKAAAEAAAFQASQEKLNLEVRLLAAQGLDEEAFLLRQRIEYLDAVNQGRDEEYLALLRQVQAAERSARARREEEVATDKAVRASKDLKSEMDNVSRALNAPSGVRLSLLRWRASIAGTPLGVAARSGGSTSPVVTNVGTVTINVSAPEGMDPQEVAQMVVREFGRLQDAGVYQPYAPRPR